MNEVILMGRLTADPETRYVQRSDGNMAVSRYSLAVDRRFSREGEQSADFISCVTFGKSAEFVDKYLSKGRKICVHGRIQTGSYTNNEGRKVYTTDVVVDQHEFADANPNSAPRPEAPKVDDDGFMNIPDGIDEELPFNN